LNLVFAGTPEFAVPTLQAILAAGHGVLAVYTQPDRPAGRGRQLTASPVKRFAQAHDLPVAQPTTLKSEHEAEALRRRRPDCMVVVAYGLILPQTILDIPTHGCLNVHASLLPRWRGAAPIQRAIEAGDSRTGVTIMQMNAGLDTGDMLRTVETPIGAMDNAQDLHDRLAQLGAQALVETLRQIEIDDVTPQPQDNQQASYAVKLSKAEALLDWTLPARVLQRKIRAYNPWPMAHTRYAGRLLRLWEAAPVDINRAGEGHAAAGTIIAMDADGIHVQTGEGVLSLLRLQWEGGRPLRAEELRHGQHLAIGGVLGGGS
jgi:methionyl-tRNA formyltransferase